LILDKAPGPAGPPLSVQIPSQESGSFHTRAVPSAPAAPASEKKTAFPPVEVEPSTAKAAAAPARADPVAGEVAKAPLQPVATSEEARALAALSDQTWVVMLDTFSDAKNVKQLRSKLTAAGVKSYTEPVKTSRGELTRVRAGPFASKEAADAARARLEAMGLKPGAVASR
jgi:DedD protein